MKRAAAICVAIVFSLVSSVYAIYTVTDTGTWPKSWPAELEPLRKPLTPDDVPVKAATVSPLPKDNRWQVQFVDAATDQPVSRLRATVTSRTADGSRTTIVMKVVSDGAFERNFNTDEHAWVSVMDEAWANADDDVRLFGNVPADVQATEKQTNPKAPFIVKVKPRVKQANAGADADKPDITDERQRNLSTRQLEEGDP